MSDLTAKLNQHSIESIRREINKKTSSMPYFANSETIENTITDMDHHPYTRWFRGVYYSEEPIIIEREAGWRPIRNSCYALVMPVEETSDPQHCFEAPHTTTFPCHLKYSSRHADKEALDSTINSTCMTQHR